MELMTVSHCQRVTRNRQARIEQMQWNAVQFPHESSSLPFIPSSPSMDSCEDGEQSRVAMIRVVATLLEQAEDAPRLAIGSTALQCEPVDSCSEHRLANPIVLERMCSEFLHRTPSPTEVYLPRDVLSDEDESYRPWPAWCIQNTYDQLVRANGRLRYWYQKGRSPLRTDEMYSPDALVVGGARNGRTSAVMPTGPAAGAASSHVAPKAATQPRPVNERSTAVSDATAAMAQGQSTVLVYHGSFAPMHVGHLECLRVAQQFLREQGINVQFTVMGFTTEEYVINKTSDQDFANINIRYAIAREVLAHGAQMPSPVHLDSFAYSAATALASKYAMHGRPLFLVGSDVMKKPSKDTLVVTRSTSELCSAKTTEFFNTRNLSGLCFQRRTLNVNSTKVRNALQQKKLPVFYSDKAKVIIGRLLGWNVNKWIKEEVEHSDTPATPAKAMPARRTVANTYPTDAILRPAPTAPAALATGSASNRPDGGIKLVAGPGADSHTPPPSTDRADLRQPLKRRRPKSAVLEITPQDDAQLQLLECEERPPLPRRRRVQGEAP
eukprot:6281851-Amphidinium_carterae.1